MADIKNNSLKWKFIKDYDKKYKINRLSSITSMKNGKTKILKQSTSVTGYKVVSLFKEGKERQWKVHRLVAMAFLKNPDKLPCVNHINGIKTDNRVENLEWCTHLHNTKHAREMGLERSVRKLTDVDVGIIEIFRHKRNLSLAKISKALSVNENVVTNILKGKIYKDVPRIFKSEKSQE